MRLEIDLDKKPPRYSKEQFVFIRPDYSIRKQLDFFVDVFIGRARFNMANVITVYIIDANYVKTPYFLKATDKEDKARLRLGVVFKYT